MTTLEVIDELCAVSNKLLWLVRRQNAIIQQADVPDRLKEELGTEASGMEERMDILEYKMRRI